MPFDETIQVLSIVLGSNPFYKKLRQLRHLFCSGSSKNKATVCIYFI